MQTAQVQPQGEERPTPRDARTTTAIDIPATTTLRERARRRITRILDRLDERWSDDAPGMRWSGPCWFQHDWNLPPR
jgi:hypothetical protein